MPKHTENSTQTSLSSAKWSASRISWNGEGRGTITDEPDDPDTGSLRKCNSDTKYQVTRSVSLPCTENTVALHMIVKYTKRLIFVLQELVADGTPTTCGQGRAVAKLLKKVRRFLEDLDQSTDVSDRLTALLNEYNGYRTEYYYLRNRIHGVTERKRYGHRRSSLPSTKGTGHNSTTVMAKCRNGALHQSKM